MFWTRRFGCQLFIFLLAISSTVSRAEAIKNIERDFRVQSANIPVADIVGHVIPASGQPKGTLIFCHGYARDQQSMRGFNWVCGNPGWNMVTFDFREHGQSTRTWHLSTLGYHEIWDLKAVVDYCDRQGMQKPFVVYGASMGGSVALRWASMDDRIKGVFAAAPFANAYDATREMVQYKTHLPLPSPFVLSFGFKKMLKQVDLPSAVARRDDLPITILVGEHDAFSVTEEHAILNGSRSAESAKHLYVIPGLGHGAFWRWQGDSVVPSHDELLRQFLNSIQTVVGDN